MAYLIIGPSSLEAAGYLLLTGDAGSAVSITSVSQVAGTINGGSTVTVTGTNFSVGMTSTLGTVSAITATTAVITTSSHASGAVTFTLTDLQGFSATPQTFTYIGNPTITSVSQNAGKIGGGDVLSLVGTNFYNGLTTATLGTLSAITSTTATLTTSSHAAGGVSWTLAVDGVTTTPRTFTYLAAPATPSISPAVGPTNATQAVTVTSTNLPFGFSGVPFSITVGGTALTSLTATASTTATGTIPSGGTGGAADVVVSVDGVTATGSGVYTFANVPSITSLTPNFGATTGSTSVSVVGTGFVAGMTSNLGTVSAITATTCTITTNSGSAGAFAATVTTIGGTSSSKTFTYALAPTITGINIDFASANGGESRIITGTNLGTATLTVDSVSATITAQSATTITFTVPACAVSATDGKSTVSTVTVSNSGITASTAGAALNSLWYVPAYFGVANNATWTTQKVTLSGSNIATVPDLTGNGYTLTPQNTAPVYHATGGGSGGNLPYWQQSAGDGSMGNSSYPANGLTLQTEWVLAMRMTADTGRLCDLGPFNVMIYDPGSYAITQFCGGLGANAVTVTPNVDFHLVSHMASTGSSQILNGGTPVTGSNPNMTVTSAGITVGGCTAHPTLSIVGFVYFAANYRLPLTTQGRANYANYFANEGL